MSSDLKSGKVKWLCCFVYIVIFIKCPRGSSLCIVWLMEECYFYGPCACSTHEIFVFMRYGWFYLQNRGKIRIIVIMSSNRHYSFKH